MQSSAAELVSPDYSPPESRISGIRDFKPQSATTVRDWLAQVEAATVQVNRVTLDRTSQGLEISLNTQGDKLLRVDIDTFRIEGNRLMAEIPDAVLALPEGAFLAENPTADVASVQVIQNSANSIRITVTGNNAPPQTSVLLKVGEAIYALNPQTEEAEEEILVTGEARGRYQVPNASSATRTDTPIRDTPAAIQVIPQTVIRDQQVVGINEALSNVSSVGFKGAIDSRGYNFTIRGFDNVPVLRDGLRVYGGVQGIAETANLDRIEVLKGPAAILYGDVQPGGVINLVSKPPLSTPFHEAEVQVGSRNLVRPRIDFTGPLTEDGKVLYRFNLLSQTNDSWRDYTTPLRRWSFAPTLTWKLNDRTDLTTFLEYVHEKTFADFGQIIVGNTLAKVPRSRVPNNPDDSITNQYLRVGYNLEHRLNENWKIRNSFSYQDSRFDYSAFALPFNINLNTNILGRAFADQDGISKVYSFQTNAIGKFATGSIQHTLLAGVDLAQSENQLTTKNTFPSQPLVPFNIFAPNYPVAPDESRLPLSNDNLLKGRRLGIYLQDQLSLFDNKLIVLAGVRYDSIDRTNTNRTLTRLTEVRSQDSAVTPRVGLLYRVAPDLSIYGSYSRSFNPAATEFGLPLTVGGDVLAPETGEGFEAGVKAEFLNRKLALTFAYFDVRKQNVAVSDPQNIGFSIATGEQRSRGVELDVIGEILPGWNIIGSYAYIPDAEITKDTTPANVGSRLSNIPKHRASFWTTYEIQRGNLKGLGLGLGFNFVGERFGGLPTSYRADSYFLTNAAVFYRTGKWRFAVNVKNLFDINYVQALSQVSRTRGNYPGEPLTVIGSVSVEF
jgi:iron complex outermembrane receptor protein